MNGRQVKKWTLISIIFCYVFLMAPVMVSKMNTWVLDSGLPRFMSVEDTIGKIIVSLLILSLLILLIYSDNVLQWLDKTKIGRWIFAPVSSYKK